MEKELNRTDHGPVLEPAVVSDFKEVVQESKAAVENAAMVPPKGKQGRKRLPRDANGNIIRDPSKVSGRVVPDQSSTANPSAAAQPAPDISKSLIAPIKMVGKYPAQRWRIPELAFDDEEAAALAKSLSDLYGAFAPAGQMDPKTAAICNFGLVAGSVFITKYQIFLAKRPKPTKDAPPVEETLPEGHVFQTVSAEDAFNKFR